MSGPISPSLPLVSVILTTRDRPRFLAIALRCYAHQSYENRELIVVDDGDSFPVDPARVAEAGGRVIRVAHGSSIGAKLNAGIETARGHLCQKMDDDDWYGPRFLERLVERRLAVQSDLCLPLMTFMMPFLFFELEPWEIRRSIDRNVPGATLMFDRDDWRERPFRDLARDEDVWFYHDHTRLGTRSVPIDDIDIYLAVRHHGISGDRGHTWTHQHGQQTLEEYLRSRPLHPRQPEDLLPEWALHAYRGLRADLIGAGPGGSDDS